MLKVLNDPSFIHEVVQLKEELEQFDKMGYNIIEIVDDDYGVIDLSQVQADGKVEQKA